MRKAKHTERMKRLPPLALDMTAIMAKAETIEGALTYESSTKGMAYAAEKDSVLIFTRSGGYLHLSIEDTKQMLVEVSSIVEDMERW